jgi:hypothetical protein
MHLNLLKYIKNQTHKILFLINSTRFIIIMRLDDKGDDEYIKKRIKHDSHIP